MQSKSQIMQLSNKLQQAGYAQDKALAIAHNWQRWHDLDFIKTYINALSVDFEIFATFLKQNPIYRMTIE